MPAPQQNQQADNSLTPLWILIGVFIFSGILWYFYHTQMANFVLKIRLFEMNIIGLFTNNLIPEANIIRGFKTSDFSAINFTYINYVSTLVGKFLRYPVVLLLIGFAVILYATNGILKFKKTYTMQRLIDDEKSNWPQITPILNVDLIKINIEEGPWAMAMTPMQFAKQQNLLQREQFMLTDAASLKDRTRVNVTLIKGEAYQAFASQLGQYWPGVSHLNIYTQALFAVFAARANRDRDGAERLLKQIALSSLTGKLDFSGTAELTHKHKDTKLVIQTIQKHAFTITVMASLLVVARNDGVLATADFLWLKPLDRRLWFMLNAVGRQTPSSEVAGPFAHWKAEVEMGRKLNVPMVEQAVLALEIAILETKFKPDEE